MKILSFSIWHGICLFPICQINCIKFFPVISSKLALEKNSLKDASIRKDLLPVENTRAISKKDMILNNKCPKIEVNPETYEVKADGEIITCEPAKELPLAQRYFMF